MFISQLKDKRLFILNFLLFICQLNYLLLFTIKLKFLKISINKTYLQLYNLQLNIRITKTITATVYSQNCEYNIFR